MRNFWRKPGAYVLFLAIILAGYFVIILVRSFSGGVPRAFSEARLQGALISQSIVETSSKSAETLRIINQYDKEGNFKEALGLVTAEVTRTQEMRSQAVKLSQELETMTKALSDLNSFEARQAALEAISNHLAVISRLVNYSDYLGRLLEVLKDRFVGNIQNGNQVSVLVDQINAEVGSINSFNNQATKAMERFDILVRK